jgi:hypothetical protein
MIEIAKMYNIITAKLKHTPLPVSLREFSQMVELAQEQPVRIRDCLKQLHKKNVVRKVPISNNIDMRERVGYEWVGRTPQSDAKIIQALITPKPIVKTEDDIRIKVNADHSVTIITKAIRITIEVPT